jgi:hypothetical protein
MYSAKHIDMIWRKEGIKEKNNAVESNGEKGEHAHGASTLCVSFPEELSRRIIVTGT